MTGQLSRGGRTTAAAIGLSTFLAVALTVILVLSATIRPWGASNEVTYRAEFTDASRLSKGDQVRVAGVAVGRVLDVDLDKGHRADVTFAVTDDLALTEGTRAQVRYLNLVGDRYLALQEGEGKKLREGGTIPVSRTLPALDLSDLFNGFKPLFAALSPGEVNKLATEIIATLQGEATTVDSLLQHTADLTQGLADRDAVIGRVVTNLNTVLGTVDERQVELVQLVQELTRFLSGLAKDRAAIGDAITHIDQLAAVTTDLLRETRPGLRKDIAELGELAATLDSPASRKQLTTVITTTASKLARIIRTGSYGSWFNFYVCDIRLDLAPSRGISSSLDLLFDRLEAVSAHDSSPRCSR